MNILLSFGPIRTANVELINSPFSGGFYLTVGPQPVAEWGFLFNQL